MRVTNERGITLVALTITIVVLIILAGITIKFGSDTISKAELENIKTNMLLLQGKLKTYAEQAKFEKKTEVGIGNSIAPGSNIASKASNAGITDITGWYYFTNDQMDQMGLKGIQKEEGDFIVKFDIENATVKEEEVVYTPGYKGNYTLKGISEI